MANLKRMMKRFGEEVGKLTFAPPVTYVYNPLDYAFAGHEAFINKFFRRTSSGAGEEGDAEPRPTMLVSMNPGPHGMTQSGVPFGAPKIVQSWMGINLPPDAVRPPEAACPYRPIFGFSPVPITPTEVGGKQKKSNNDKTRKKRIPARQPTLREEASGKRIYVNWAMNTYLSAEAFFEQFYIHPYCPLQFLEASGTNITPDKLHKDDRTRLYEVCDRYLREAILMMRPERIVTIGNFADDRVRYTLRRWQEEEEVADKEDKELLQRLVVGKIPHPSPRSPVARLVWAPGAHKVNELLRSFGVDVPLAAGAETPASDVDESTETSETNGSTKRGRASTTAKSPTGLPLSKRRRTQQAQREG